MVRHGRTGWTAADMPSLAGRTAVVTGANSGLGLQTSIELARHGAAVTLACRDVERGRSAVQRVRAETGSDTARLAVLDLADLASVRRFAQEWDGPLDLLVDNAGVMAVPQGRTADGFERQMGTNHLGHFALTGLLLPALRESSQARVVVVSSSGHRIGRIHLDDLQNERRSYNRWTAYGQSKLANLLFVRELGRRLHAAGDRAVVAAAHPGAASTNLVQGFAGRGGTGRRVADVLMGSLAQDDAHGALPSLYAASMPDVATGDYLGPDGPGEVKGYPVRVGTSAAARDGVMAARLWRASEQLTGVVYPDLPGLDLDAHPAAGGVPGPDRTTGAEVRA